jgi:adenosylmethionine-8-amino-7-oxononanoate aminotransferase
MTRELWPYLLPTEEHGRDDLCAVSASGHRVRFLDGRELLCGTSGLWNASLGYGNPVIADAIATAARTASYLGVFRYENVAARRAAADLVAACGSDRYARVLYSTSGGAANDAVMKLARHYQILCGQSQRRVVVGLRGSYHGLTYGAFALTGDDLGQHHYGVDRRYVRHVEPNSVAQLEDLMVREGRRAAAVVVEPVLGTGAIPLTPDYVEALLLARDRYGFLLVADEVATGFGRTGTFLASQGWPAPPDVLLLSKGLTNGTCAAAVIVVSRHVAARFDHGALLAHAETQGGTAIASAAISATLSEMDRHGAVGMGRRVSAWLEAGLAHVHPSVERITGVGCFRSLRLSTPCGQPLPQSEVGRVVAHIRAAGAIVHPGPSGVQLIPALTYEPHEVAELLDCVRRGLSDYLTFDWPSSAAASTLTSRSTA